MINNLLNTSTIQILEKALDATSLRNGVISDNIANVDTPGYKRSDVSFEDELKKAMGNDGIQGELTDPRHIPIGQANFNEVTSQVIRDETTSSRLDGNNVDIDNEMAKLAKNQLVYNALAQSISDQFSRLSYVINDGRR